MNKSTNEIRQMFIDFFYSNGHHIVKSSSLIPENDKTLLFTNAGMNQFKDVFLGLDKRSYKRATTSQRCVRLGGKHNDLDKVGNTTYHHTFFEMLGNFSFGDYFKYDAIKYAWELLTSKKWFSLSKKKIWVTVYHNDYDTYKIWLEDIGLPAKRIIRIGDYNINKTYLSDNFWQMGETGPCGPCSEIFYDRGNNIQGLELTKNYKNNKRYIEIWNLVFMQFDRQNNGSLLPLPKLSVDTGMGLERITSVIQNVNSNYDIDIFKKLISITAYLLGTKDINNKSLKIIVDHIRSSTFLIIDGVLPSNEGRGYALRKIIRRAIFHGNKLGNSSIFFYNLVKPLIETMGKNEIKLYLKQKIVEKVLYNEEIKFNETLKKGLILLNKKINTINGKILNGNIAFLLYDTYGFPLELTIDICKERNIIVDKSGFKYSMNLQRKRSKKTNFFKSNFLSTLLTKKITNFVGYEKNKKKGKIINIIHNNEYVDILLKGEKAIVILDITPFYGESGGQTGDKGFLISKYGIFQVTNVKKINKLIVHYGFLKKGKIKLNNKIYAKIDYLIRKDICSNHSATHLLHTTLKNVLGKDVKQKGSLINEKYLRFDFSYSKKIKFENILQIENIINEQIRNNYKIFTNIMKLNDVYKKNIISLFKEKYNDKVRVLHINNFSSELCAGTHVTRTGDIGIFIILSHYNIASGIHRIEAVTGREAVKYLQKQNNLVTKIKNYVKGNNETILKNISNLKKKISILEKDIKYFKNKFIVQTSLKLVDDVYNINGTKILLKKLNKIEVVMLRPIIEYLKNVLKSSIIVLALEKKEKINLITSVTNDISDKITAIDIINYLTKKIGGKGGGRINLAQSGGIKKNNFDLLNVFKILKKNLIKKFK